MLFKSNELSRAEIEQYFSNFGCDGPNERVQVIRVNFVLLIF